MSSILVNPGSGKCEEGTWEQAYENIKQYIKDCEIYMYLVSSNFIPDNGRYLFVLRSDVLKHDIEVEMPALPLEQVRFIGEEGQNCWNFPRLYVDGSSWLWKYAIIKIKNIISSLEEEIDEYEVEIERKKNIIQTLKEGD